MKLPTIFTKKLTADKKIPLARWICRAYCKSVLVPLLCIQLLLVGFYFLTEVMEQRQQLATLNHLAASAAKQLTQVEAKGISQQLATITQAAVFLQSHTTQVIRQKNLIASDDPARAAQRQLAFRNSLLDPVYRSMEHFNKLIAKIYFSNNGALSRSYPYRGVMTYLPQQLDIPVFTFNDQDDALNNPSRSVVWTDIYHDKASQSWMSSVLAPVYQAQRLQGIVGIDVRLDSLLSEVRTLNIAGQGYAMIVGQNGNIIAMPALGEQHWGKVATPWLDTATEKIGLQPVAFQASDNASKLLAQISLQDDGVSRSDLGGVHLVSWALIPQTGWKLVVTMPTQQLPGLNNSSDQHHDFNWWLASVLLALDLIFVIMLYRQARKMSQSLSAPLARINKMVSTVTYGEELQPGPEFAIAELNETAQGIVLMGLLLDVASKSRQQAEAKLEQRNRQLQLVFDLSPDGLILTDSLGQVLLLNPALCQMAGIDPAEYLFKPDQLLWQKLLQLSTTPEANLPDVLTSFRMVLDKPQQRVLQCQILNMDEQDSASAVKLIYLRDITRDAAVDQMKSEFITTAAHELRTPLTSVLGYTELLMKDMIPTDMRAEAFAIVVSKTMLVINIINEMLDLARIEARHGMDFNFQPYLADVLVKDVVNSYPLPPSRSPIIIATLADLFVNVDQAKFKAVLTNLLDNAYKYSTSGDVQLHIIKETRARKLWVGFRLQDAGIGMNPQQIGHAFDRFWRADASGNIPGTGLGLAIVKEVMRVFGGSIDIESAPAIGTTVTLWLPAVYSGKNTIN